MIIEISDSTTTKRVSVTAVEICDIIEKLPSACYLKIISNDDERERAIEKAKASPYKKFLYGE